MHRERMDPRFGNLSIDPRYSFSSASSSFDPRVTSYSGERRPSVSRNSSERNRLNAVTKEIELPINFQTVFLLAKTPAEKRSAAIPFCQDVHSCRNDKFRKN